MSQINKLRAEANAPKRSKCLNYSAPRRAVCASARNALLQIRLAAKECNQIVSLLLSGQTHKAIDPLGPVPTSSFSLPTGGPSYLQRKGLGTEELCAKNPG